MARPDATHRAVAPSRTPATRDRTGRLHRHVHGRPAPAGTPAYSMIPGWRPPPRPGSPGDRRHPAGSPPIPEPGPRARRHPGVRPVSRSPLHMIHDQPHRQGDGPCAAGTTDGDVGAPRQSRKTLSAADEDEAGAFHLLVEYVVYDLGFELMIGRRPIRPRLQVDGRLEFYDRSHSPGLHLLGWLFDTVRSAILGAHVYDMVVKSYCVGVTAAEFGEAPEFSAHVTYSLGEDTGEAGIAEPV